MSSTGRAAPHVGRRGGAGREFRATGRFEQRRTRRLEDLDSPIRCTSPSTSANRCVVDVDAELGLVKVIQMDVAQDVGKAVNPVAAHYQIAGGSVMGMGLALMEHLQVADGHPVNTDFSTYMIPTAVDVPGDQHPLRRGARTGNQLWHQGMGELPHVQAPPSGALCAARGDGARTVRRAGDRGNARRDRRAQEGRRRNRLVRARLANLLQVHPQWPAETESSSTSRRGNHYAPIRDAQTPVMQTTKPSQCDDEIRTLLPAEQLKPHIHPRFQEKIVRRSSAFIGAAVAAASLALAAPPVQPRRRRLVCPTPSPLPPRTSRPRVHSLKAPNSTVCVQDANLHGRA